MSALSRRSVLRLYGSLGGSALAGCLGSPSSENDPSTSRSPESATTTPSSHTQSPTQRSPLSTENIVLHTTLRYIEDPDIITLTPPENDQLVYIKPLFTEDSPPPSAYTLDIEGRQFSPQSTAPGIHLKMPGISELYTESNRFGWLMFDLPLIEAKHGALVRGSDRYPLPTESLSPLAVVPEFTVESVSVPESVAPDERIEIILEITNTGGRQGMFLAGVQQGGLPQMIDATVAVDETTTARTHLEVYEEEAETFSLITVGNKEFYRVAIEDQ